MMKKLDYVFFMVILVITFSINAAPIITATNATASTSFYSATANQVINVTHLDPNNMLKVRNVWGNWLFDCTTIQNTANTAPATFTSYQWIYIDLGKNYDLDEIRIWNYFDSAAGVTGRGIKNFDIYVAGDGATVPAGGTVPPGGSEQTPFTGPNGWSYLLGSFPDPTNVLAIAPQATVPINPTNTFVVATMPAAKVVRYIGIDVGTYIWSGSGGGSIGGLGHIQVTGTVSSSPIIISSEPNALTVTAGTNAIFTTVASGYTSAKWKKDGIVVSDGPTGSGATISGATTNQLTITNVQIADEGNYGCELAASIYKATTSPVQLLTKRLISYWPLDGDLTDAIGPWDANCIKGPDITRPDEPYFDTGIIGTSALDHTLAGVRNSGDYFDFYTRGFTSSFWFKADVDASLEGIVSKFDWSNSQGFHNYISSPATNFVTAIDGAALSAIGAVIPEQWNFAATTYDSNSAVLKLYVNGKIYARWRVAFGPKGKSNANVSFGGVDPYQFHGYVDDIKIYSYAVSGQALAQEYVNGTKVSTCYCSDWDLKGGSPIGGDCKVDFKDFAEFALHYWFGSINLLDLNDFASQWLNSSVTLNPM